MDGALADLAASVRRLIDATVSVAAPPDALRRATAAVDRIVATLQGHVPTPLPPRYPGLPPTAIRTPASPTTSSSAG